MSFPTVIIGCNYLTEFPKHINPEDGMFRAFKDVEPLEKLLQGVIIPAKNNTGCEDRDHCSIECHMASNIWIVGGHVSTWQNKQM